jgi:hypothetical protein
MCMAYNRNEIAWLSRWLSQIFSVPIQFLIANIDAR